jgi:hypothetical protein
VRYLLDALRWYDDDGSSLLSVIEETVAAESWDILGGDGALEFVNDVLVVHQSDSIHRRVAKLLSSLEQHLEERSADIIQVRPDASGMEAKFEDEQLIRIYPVDEILGRAVDLDEVAGVIIDVIKSPSWEEMGGSGAMATWPPDDRQALIVAQTGEVHQQIEEFLHLIRDAGQSSDRGPLVRVIPPRPATAAVSTRLYDVQDLLPALATPPRRAGWLVDPGESPGSLRQSFGALVERVVIPGFGQGKENAVGYFERYVVVTGSSSVHGEFVRFIEQVQTLRDRLAVEPQEAVDGVKLLIDYLCSQKEELSWGAASLLMLPELKPTVRADIDRLVDCLREIDPSAQQRLFNAVVEILNRHRLRTTELVSILYSRFAELTWDQQIRAANMLERERQPLAPLMVARSLSGLLKSADGKSFEGIVQALTTMGEEASEGIPDLLEALYMADASRRPAILKALRAVDPRWGNVQAALAEWQRSEDPARRPRADEVTEILMDEWLTQ